MFPTKSLTSFLLYFVKQHKWQFLLIQLFSLAWALDNTLWPYAFSLLVDKFVAYPGETVSIWMYLLPVLIFLASLWLTIEIMFRLGGFMMSYVMPRFEANIRTSMFAFVQNHSARYFADHLAGNIANKINDMPASAHQVVSLILWLFVPGLAALIIVFALFMQVHFGFALIIFTWVCMHMGICLYYAPKCTELSHEQAEARSELSGRIVDIFTNILNVKIFARQRVEFNGVSVYQEDERQKHVRALCYLEWVRVRLGILCFIFPGVIMFALLIYSWEQQWLTVGEVVLVMNATANVTIIAWIAGIELPNFFREAGVCRQAMTIIQAPHELTDKPDASTLTVEQGKICFDKVSFAYHGHRQIFENKNIVIEPMSKVGLVGYSGSGKSTFVNLIMRFFDVQSGKILIDGQNIADVTAASLRENIAMIPQDPTLFHRSLMENIRYGRLDATDEEVMDAAKRAHCDDFIRKLPEGYDTLVGERGVKISGGQRQLISIARAMLKHAPILMMDEATSALDSVTETIIQDHMKSIMDGATTLVIAHRLSTLALVDRILVFDQGRIIEDGTHDTLLAKGGHYAHMWHKQAGGFLPS